MDKLLVERLLIWNNPSYKILYQDVKFSYNSEAEGQLKGQLSPKLLW